MSESAPAPPTYPCPQCGQQIPEPTNPAVNLLECPHCGNQFFIKRAMPARRPMATGDFAERVRDLARGRRELIRYRSYFVIGGIACFVLLGQVIFSLIRYRWTPTGRSLMGILAVLFVVGMVFFARRAMAVTALLRRPVSGKPATPPDLDALR